MATFDLPPEPIPEPLRGAEIGTFTHSSIVVRLPDIGRRMLAENDFSDEVGRKLEELFSGIPSDPIRHLDDAQAPDIDAWRGYIQPYVGLDWLQPPWFFVETYFYRRILEATGYFQDGPGQGLDPFIQQKRSGLDASAAQIEALARLEGALLEGASRDPEGRQAGLGELLHLNLWGNQADLSLWPVGADALAAQPVPDPRQSQILVDESLQAITPLLGPARRPARIDLILDNAGFELVSDLTLADYLLGAGIAGGVQLHTKAHPTFVSDAMDQDVLEAVTFLSASPDADVSALGQRLDAHLEARRLWMAQDFFWNSPLPLWEMPASLRRELARFDLLVSKGDANYRRLLGDRHWPFTIPFQEILRYQPAPLLALRVMKSEIVAGLQPGQIQEATRQDADWMIDGHWGVIQYSR